MPVPQPWDRSRDARDLSLRISDADRHAVAEVLREAAGDGRIDFAELDERLEATYAARTYADLVPITLDLPVAGGRIGAAPETPDPATLAEPETHLAILSGVNRTGVWRVPAHLQITCVLGGADLDLRHATFAAKEVVITINAFMGGASIKVGPETHVVLEGTGIMGGYSGPSGLVDAELGPDSPSVRIRGFAFWGGVSVERKHL